MNVTIEKLTKDSLTQAETLRDKVFGKTKKTEALTLRASLNPKEYKNVYEDNYIKDMEYWIAKSNDKVIGTIGLYTDNYEKDNSCCWLGWFAVKPKFRGNKIGKKLLDFAVNEAKERGYVYLKLYTYDSDEFKIAKKLYKKEGFEEFNRKKKELYFIKKLNKGTKMKEIHPFKPYIPEDATKLIIGTIPPPRFAKNELLDKDVNFYYGSKDNNFWDIIGEIANIDFKKVNTQEEVEKRKKFLDNNKIGICDIVYKTNRKNENSAADDDLIDIEPLDIINEILVKYPTIDTLIYTSKFVKTQIRQLLKKLYEKEICHISSEDKDKKTLTINDKIYNVAILYSPSNNANRRISNEQRIEQYKKYLGGH